MMIPSVLVVVYAVLLCLSIAGSTVATTTHTGAASLVADLLPGPLSSEPGRFLSFGGSLFFLAYSTPNARYKSLFRLVKDESVSAQKNNIFDRHHSRQLPPYTAVQAFPSNFSVHKMMPFQDQLFVLGSPGLQQVDLTTPNAKYSLVSDQLGHATSFSPSSFYGSDFAVVHPHPNNNYSGSRLYFSAKDHVPYSDDDGYEYDRDADRGNEVWMMTEDKTTQLALDLNPNAGSQPQNFNTANGYLFFTTGSSRGVPMVSNGNHDMTHPLLLPNQQAIYVYGPLSAGAVSGNDHSNQNNPPLVPKYIAFVGQTRNETSGEDVWGVFASDGTHPNATAVWTPPDNTRNSDAILYILPNNNHSNHAMTVIVLWQPRDFYRTNWQIATVRISSKPEDVDDENSDDGGATTNIDMQLVSLSSLPDSGVVWKWIETTIIWDTSTQGYLLLLVGESDNSDDRLRAVHNIWYATATDSGIFLDLGGAAPLSLFKTIATTTATSTTTPDNHNNKEAKLLMVAEMGDKADLYIVYTDDDNEDASASTSIHTNRRRFTYKYDKVPISWPDDAPALRVARKQLTSHIDNALYFGTNAGREGFELWKIVLSPNTATTANSTVDTRDQVSSSPAPKQENATPGVPVTLLTDLLPGRDTTYFIPAAFTVINATTLYFTAPTLKNVSLPGSFFSNLDDETVHAVPTRPHAWQFSPSGENASTILGFGQEGVWSYNPVTNITTVLTTQVRGVQSSRRPLQFGDRVYFHGQSTNASRGTTILYSVTNGTFVNIANETGARQMLETYVLLNTGLLLFRGQGNVLMVLDVQHQSQPMVFSSGEPITFRGSLIAWNGQACFLSEGTVYATDGITVRRMDLFGNNTIEVGRVGRINDEYFYFMALLERTDSRPHQFWVSDGTASGTVVALEEDLSVFGSMGTTAYLVSRSIQQAYRISEIYVSDGTNAGTGLFADIFPYTNPRYFTVLGDKFYFLADRGDTVSLWGSDGTSSNTKIVLTHWPNGVAAFSTLPEDYRGTDGNRGMLAWGDSKLVFVANNGTTGNETWVIDLNTRLSVKDEVPAAASAGNTESSTATSGNSTLGPTASPPENPQTTAPPISVSSAAGSSKKLCRSGLIAATVACALCFTAFTQQALGILQCLADDETPSLL